jgi:hypothetical protein
LWRIEESDRKIGDYSLEVIPWLRQTTATQFWPAPVHPRALRLGGGVGVGGGGGRPALGDGGGESGSEGGDGNDSGSEGGCGGDGGWGTMLRRLLLELGVDEPIGPPPPPQPRVPIPPPALVPDPAGAPDAGPAVPPPPAPAVPRAPRARRGGPRYLHYDMGKSAGVVIGYALVNENAGTIDVHCSRHGAECSVSRTFLRYEGEGALTPLRSSRGRPFAFLQAWLQWGMKWPRGDEHRDAHIAASKCKGEAAVLADGRSRERVRARAYVESTASLHEVRRAERRPRDGEGLEPPGPF